MAKGKRNPNWKEKVLEWEASGKSCQAWCRENNIPYTTFCGWRERLKKSNKAPNKTKTGFIELKDQISSDIGITLEYKEVKIHLKAGFDKIVLQGCFDTLKGIL